MTHDTDARRQLSEMTGITEIAIAGVLDRNAHLDALYRDCPTAFWLAPDADLSIPFRAAVVESAAPLPVDDFDAAHTAVHGRSTAIWRALVAAGPIFAATGLMFGESASDLHWWDPFGRALASLIAFPLTITVGALLALLPVLTGVFAMGATGATFPEARRPVAWGVTGGGMGLAIAALVDANGPVALALVATSVACASIARAAVDWDDPVLA